MAGRPVVTASGSLTPGTILQGGRYVIDRPLGKGGMGSVFLARDTHVNNKLVAIKKLAIPATATPAERQEAEAAFQAEMQTLASLCHPTIPAICDFFVEGSSRFLVQEYVAGQDLEHAIQAVQVPGKPPVGLPEQQVLSWASQVLAALDYLEGQNPQVIHRDIKPGNLLVDAQGRMRLVDFGIATRKFKPGTPRALGQPPSLAQGTQGYAPREQFQGLETVLSDLYALGATMHHLLSGRDPTTVQPLWQYPPVRDLNPRVSEATARIVARAVQNDPARRYQSAQEMKRDVDRVLNPPGLFTTVRGRTIAVLAVLLLLALTVLATDEATHLRTLSAPPLQRAATPAPLPTATQMVVALAPPATATPGPTAPVVPATTTTVPSPTNTATAVPTNTPAPSPTPSVGRELRRVTIPPTTSATFATADNMIVDGDVRYPAFAVAATLAGTLIPPRTGIGRVAYSAQGGQVADLPLGNGATTIQFSGPIPDRTVDQEVQAPLSQHGCEGTCQAIQVYFFSGAKVLSTCVHRGEHFHAADLAASPNPPCL